MCITEVPYTLLLFLRQLYPKLSFSSYSCTAATPGENPAEDKPASKMGLGTTRQHHKKCPKHRKEPTSCRKAQESLRINRDTSQVQRVRSHRAQASSHTASPALVGLEIPSWMAAPAPAQGENGGAFNTLSLQDTDRRW